jgi:tRNA (uracil-5-)-methyltransferase
MSLAEVSSFSEAWVSTSEIFCCGYFPKWDSPSQLYNFAWIFRMLRAKLFRAFWIPQKAFCTISSLKMLDSAAAAAPNQSSDTKKRPFDGKGSYRFKKKKRTEGFSFTGSHEEVLLEDVRGILNELSLESKDFSKVEPAKTSLPPNLPQLQSELDLTVRKLSSTGDGLATLDGLDHVFVVPFSAPGDTVRAKVYKQFQQHKYSLTDFVKVVTPSAERDDSLVKCQYFSKCSGCQFQMLPYHYQLAHKKTIVEKAYQNFSGLSSELVPKVDDTIGSPLEYGYRTKLTPHFDAPPGSRRSDGRNGVVRSFDEVPPIGFMKKGTMVTLDIEDCPIGTDAVRLGMKRERKRVADELGKYHRGVTILLRESTRRIPTAEVEAGEPEQIVETDQVVRETSGEWTYLKRCITDSKATSTEFIDNFVFDNPAGAFFQNNNSILPVFTNYIREHVLPPTNGSQITHLIDAYSGSGLFTITLSAMFKRSIGIDISPSSIESARHNAHANNLPESQADFIAADAANLFAKVTFPAEETVVVIDPPRKGCDESFLKQSLRYGPARIVYVSCNVHTQARDVGLLVGGMRGVDGGFGEGNGAYDIESLVGFDFFPQTGHVEGVAVLQRKEAMKSTTS